MSARRFATAVVVSIVGGALSPASAARGRDEPFLEWLPENARPALAAAQRAADSVRAAVETGSFERALVAMIVSATLVGAAAVPASAGTAPEPTVSIAVGIDRMVFGDRLERATFLLVGACLEGTDDVHVIRAACSEDPDTVDETEGTVRKAALGFDAVRTVEAGDSDIPVTENAQADVSEQLDSVRVVLNEPGDLTVAVTGHPTEAVDPTPVPGSASDGGQIANRSVVWQRPAATPGVHEFSVAFRPGASEGFDGTFVPEVRVELRDRSRTLLRYETGSVEGSAEARRTSTLTMRQRVAPRWGDPAMATDSYYPIRGSAALPTAWETSAHMDGRGAHQALLAAPVSAERIGPLDELAPGSVGIVNVAFMSSSGVPVRGQAKAGTEIGFQRDENNNPSAFVARVTTFPPSEPGSVGERSLGSSIWDSDAMVFGSGAGVATVRARRDGLPENSNGAVASDWEGGLMRTWSGTWANLAPFAEPNALNPGPYTDVRLSTPRHNYAAVMPMVAAGGDVDNRNGEGQLLGPPVTFAMPPGQCPSSALWFNVFVTVTKYSSALSSLDGCPGTVQLTPRVGPGGYWLESARDGYDRDWSNVTYLAFIAHEQGAGTAALSEETWHQAAVLIPPGTSGEAHAVDATTGRHRSVPLSPGSWLVTSADGRLSVHPLAGTVGGTPVRPVGQVGPG